VAPPGQVQSGFVLAYIVVKNIDVRIKNIKKHVLYPIIKNIKKTFVKKHFPYST